MNIFHAAAGLACILAPIGTAAAQAPQTPPPAAAIAVEQVAIGSPGERMLLAIWHPAGAGSPGKRLPLIVISHGTGAGPMAHVDTAEALAASGFAVVAPMHRGDNFQDESLVGRPGWIASRARDVSAAIDYMLQQSSRRPQIDPGRVGIFGFSAGATTALVAAGGLPDLARLAPHCAARREFACNLFAPQAAADPPPQWTRDARIAAAVIAAPGLGFLFEPAGLAGVSVPVQLWAGSRDETVPEASNAALVQRLLPKPPEFHRVEGAAHLSFLAPCTAEAPPAICQDPEGCDRSAVHRSFNPPVIAFFLRHLSASPGAPAGGGE